MKFKEMFVMLGIVTLISMATTVKVNVPNANIPSPEAIDVNTEYEVEIIF